MKALEERLQRLRPSYYLEEQAKITENMMKIQQNVPLGIYVI